MSKYILAFDQGTTSSRAILFDHEANILSLAQREFRQIFPEPGWVEHDPAEIWSTQLGVATEALARIGARASDVAAIGITNQRETTLVWNRKTGQPIHNAIVWQDRRTAGLCDELKASGLEGAFQQKTGLVLDAYFSGTKVAWLLDNVPGARQAAERGELAFGTVDSWLLWQLTSGEVHATSAGHRPALRPRTGALRSSRVWSRPRGSRSRRAMRRAHRRPHRRVLPRREARGRAGERGPRRRTAPSRRCAPPWKPPSVETAPPD